MKNRWSGLFLILAWSCLSHAGWAQAPGAAFLENNPSPRSFSMGGSNVVASWGAQAANANPANLGLMSSRFEAYSAYAQPIGGVQYGYLSAAVALPASKYIPIDSLGFSVIRQQIGGLEGSDNFGNVNGSSFASADMAVSMSGSGQITRGLRFGVTAKTIKSSVAGVNSNTALASDLGLSYNLRQFHGLSVGASVNNLGQGLRFMDQTDPLPASASLGASLPFGSSMLVASIDRKISEQKTDIGLGMEYAMGPVSLRGGYLTQRGNGSNLALRDQNGIGQFMNGMSAGLGIQMGTARLDYAVSQGAAELGTNQQVALTLAWGQKKFSSAKPVRSNTTIRNQAPWQQSGGDQIDWHMIQMNGK